MRAALLILLSTIATTCFGAEESPCVAGTEPVECHFANAWGAVTLCRLEAELFVLKGSGAEAITTCSKNAKIKVARTYRSASRALGKKPAAGIALKKYQARFLTAIDSVGPRMGETEREYKRRLARMEEDLEHAANEVKVEM